jgi:hypothetical protein
VFEGCDEVAVLLVDDGEEDADDILFDDCVVASADFAELTWVTAPAA